MAVIAVIVIAEDLHGPRNASRCLVQQIADLLFIVVAKGGRQTANAIASPWQLGVIEGGGYGARCWHVQELVVVEMATTVEGSQQVWWWGWWCCCGTIEHLKIVLKSTVVWSQTKHLWGFVVVSLDKL